jgi:hypothetical protein
MLYGLASNFQLGLISNQHKVRLKSSRPSVFEGRLLINGPQVLIEVKDKDLCLDRQVGDNPAQLVLVLAAVAWASAYQGWA